MSKVAGYIGKSYLRVYEFNDIAGNLDDVTIDSVSNQLSFIFEELSEAIAALEEGDEVGLLDGACDLSVTVNGLLQKLENAGFKVAEAMERVDLNNLTKMPTSLDGAIVDQSFTTEYNEKYGRHVIKDFNGKVRKPSTYKSVEIGDCAVAGFLRETKEVV